MILSFTLSMPNNNAWNGKWSGDGMPYVIIENFGKSKKGEAKAKGIAKTEYYYYDFGDGWVAGITAKKVTAQEAAALRRKSAGFCGYSWMVDSIRLYGEIVARKSQKD